MSVAQPTGPVTVTSQQIRHARALLAWSRMDLAAAAHLPPSAIAELEVGSAATTSGIGARVQSCLEGQGIQFSAHGETERLSHPATLASLTPGVPVRWVTSDDLAAWGAHPDGPVNLPTLIAYLIRATHGTAARIHFPSDGGVRHPGWDGLSTVDTGSHYVPSGVAGWELSTQRDGVSSKIREDYSKRSADPLSLEPGSSTFVAVTVQHWPGKESWAKEAVAQGPWRDVRVYDADDLVHWIEITPAVGLWLANYLGKRPTGATELEAVWHEWSLSTQWPITEELTLCDRDESAARVLRWLRSPPSVISVQSTSSEEVIAFFYATLGELPEAAASSYRARCIVVNEAAARALQNAPGPLILVLTDANPGLAASLVQSGHFVLQVYDETTASHESVRTLERPSKDGIAAALVSAGVPEPQARALARDSARNLTVLRRRIPVAPGRDQPRWADGRPPRSLLAALLAGGWDEDHPSDKHCLSQLAGSPYEQFVEEVRPYVGQFDSPLQKIGSSWRIASPSDAWHLLAGSLTSALIDQLGTCAITVLGATDPRFDMDPDERWLAGVKGVACTFSPMLRQGIARTLILLALFWDRASLVSDARSRTDLIVSNLLAGADSQRWWSLSRDFRLLAEASPASFLSAIEHSLNQDKPSIGILFDDQEAGAFGAEYLSDLMWALEALAWSPALITVVTHILSKLAAIDVKPRRYSNGPANSLREIHALWNPQTYATLAERLKALDFVRKRSPESAWNLMLGILPSGHDSLTPSPKPLWRDFSVPQIEVVSNTLVRRGAIAISERLVVDVGDDAKRFDAILDRLMDLRPNPNTLLDALDNAQQSVRDAADRKLIWGSLRRILHHNREYPDSPRRLAESVLDRLALSYEKFTPDALLDRVQWLFQSGAAMPNPTGSGWADAQSQLDEARADAIRAVYESGGISEIYSLARTVENVGLVASATCDAAIPGNELDSLIELAIGAEDAHSRHLAIGLVSGAFRYRNEEWAETLISKVSSDELGADAMLAVLMGLPTSTWTWQRVAGLGGEIERLYWSTVPILWLEDRQGELEYIIRKLMSVGRARHTLSLLRPNAQAEVSVSLLIEILNEVVNQSADDIGVGDGGMFQYYVAEAFKRLDREGVDQAVIAGLEWRFLRVLEHSSRPVRALLRELSASPGLFVQMICAIFPIDTDDLGLRASEVDDSTSVRAHQAYRLLEIWNLVPGSSEDGNVDLSALERWLSEARALAQAMGRLGFADERIGNVFSASPIGHDGIWPTEAVREMLDTINSKEMLQGFIIGAYNRRGITTRLPRDGGQQERALAAQYREWSGAISAEYPYVSKALDEIAIGYETDARHHDEDAASLDWSD